MAGKNVGRRRSAKFSERMGSIDVKLKAFVDGPRDSSRQIAYARVMDREEGVRMVVSPCSSKRTPEGMLVIGRTSAERQERKAERLNKVGI